MIIVSDTSPINNLAAINQLDLLHHLYGSVFIPEAVFTVPAQNAVGCGTGLRRSPLNLGFVKNSRLGDRPPASVENCLFFVAIDLSE